MYFNSRPPHGGRRLQFRPGHGLGNTSTHDLHTEVDNVIKCQYGVSAYFNSRPPHGGRRISLLYSHLSFGNFNSRPPHGGRRFPTKNWKPRIKTSTHDLHTEVDRRKRELPHNIVTSTHDLHTEVDVPQATKPAVELRKLQLTTSTRRSTVLASFRGIYFRLQLTTSTRRSTCLNEITHTIFI